MIPLSEPLIGTREREWVNRCLDSGFVSSAGTLIPEFETRFAERVGARYAVATASGTSALHVALRVLGIGPGDMVAVPDLTFVATVNPVLYQQADPLLVDVDPHRWCLDVERLERFFEEFPEEAARIKAVIPVHLYGCASDVPRLAGLAEEYGFSIVEDATEALGTTLDGRCLGTFGDIGCFSFNGNKTITTGSGGMLVTDSAEIAEQARYLVNQAKEPGAAYVHGAAGYNYRMTNLQAALGLAQLERLDDILMRKAEIAASYRAALAGAGWELHPEVAGVGNSYWLYSLLLPDDHQAQRVLSMMQENQVGARAFFTPLHQQPYLAQVRKWLADEPVSQRLASQGINLPSSATLTAEDQGRVLELLLSVGV